MSPNNGILLNGLLRPKLLSIPYSSCSFINLDFLLPHTSLKQTPLNLGSF